MAASRRDPYLTLGVGPGVSDAELRATYRRLVQLHHPDHNGGSAESARRFEDVQEAYAQIRQIRDASARSHQPPPRPSPSPRPTATSPRAATSPPPRAGTPPPPRPSADPATDKRLADLEREIREAHLARERARQAAREAAAEAVRRPTPEELGYVTTDDSLGKILADARSQVSERFAEAREPVTKRVADLLDEVASKLSGDSPPRARD
jgi:curved DNA-binding protein CbpA